MRAGGDVTVRAVSLLQPASLTGRTLLRVAFGVALVIVASSTTSYLLMFSELERRARKELGQSLTSRVEAESDVFVLGRDMQRAIVALALERYPLYRNAAVLERFDALVERHADGAMRSRPETLVGAIPSTIWVHRDTPLTDELKQRIVLFYDLAEQFKPAAHLRFSDIFFTAPEQLNVGTDPPGMPPWAEAIAADFDQNAQNWVSVASVDNNPTRDTVWSGPDWEPLWNELAIAIATPIDLDGRHIGTVTNDLLVDTLVDNLRRSDIEGAQYVVFRADGALIAHTNRMTEIDAAGGKLRVGDARDAELTGLWRIVERDSARERVTYDKAADQYVALTRIEGPGWYLAATLPGAVIRGKAFAAAQWVLWAGLLSLALALAVLTVVLRRSVARPLGALTAAAERVAAGDVQQPLFPARGEELARLAAAFNDMMVRIGDREAQIKRQQNALHQSEKLAAMGALLAGVAHELNNPLFVVSGRAAMLEAAAAGTPFQAAAKNIRGAAERCVRIVKTFLAMARESRPQHRLLDVDAVVRSCLDVLEYSLQTSAIEVEIERDEALPKVVGDTDHLHQVFLNLIVNAQQAMADTGGERRLRIALRHVPEEHIVEVRMGDTGPGVPEEIRGRIFEPFFTTKRIGVGTGVGLPVSLGIVQEHGGALYLDTGDGWTGGATFVVRLPVAPDAFEPPATVAPDSRVGAKRVLVVDDERDVRETLCDMLALASHSVCACSSGAEALEALQRESFDAILSDVRMPGMDGVELYREIAARSPATAERVAFMTGDGLTALHVERLTALGRPIIEKSLAPADVCRLVGELCDSASQTRPRARDRGDRAQ